MNERDIRVVENMVNCGLSLEALYAAFPKFNRADIEKVYNEAKKVEQNSEGVSISINCS